MVAFGLTVMLAVVAPVLHTKLDAPLAVRVVEPPVQIMEGEALTATVGAALTKAVTLAQDEQEPEVPVTV